MNWELEIRKLRPSVLEQELFLTNQEAWVIMSHRHRQWDLNPQQDWNLELRPLMKPRLSNAYILSERMNWRGDRGEFTPLAQKRNTKEAFNY